MLNVSLENDIHFQIMTLRENVISRDDVESGIFRIYFQSPEPEWMIVSDDYIEIELSLPVLKSMIHLLSNKRIHAYIDMDSGVIRDGDYKESPRF